MAVEAAAPRGTLRQRWLAGERLVGTFVKTTSHQTVEILARTGLDFIVLDAEHAPFDRASLDLSLLAARALRLPALVRIPDSTAGSVAAALDLGADGVLVPHIADVAVARCVAQACRYRGGTRGFSTSARSGDYGRADVAQYLDEADERTLVIAQIEDVAALNRLDELLTVPGIDGFFIGRADLAVSMGAVGVRACEVQWAVDQIAAAARARRRPLAIFLAEARPQDIARFAEAGATLFVIGSDQSLLKEAATAVMTTFHSRDASGAI